MSGKAGQCYTAIDRRGPLKTNITFYAEVLRKQDANIAVLEKFWRTLGMDVSTDILPDQLQEALEWLRGQETSMAETSYLREWERRLQAAVSSKEARKDLKIWMLSFKRQSAAMRPRRMFSRVLSKAL